jgi:type 1 glutamine amidotransferase
LFDVDIATTASSGTDESFQPKFTDYDVVVSNYNGAAWPEATQKAFVQYMNDGGGLVVVHAADNAFEDWEEYNRMIGLGGWGGRNQNSGPYVYYDEQAKNIVRDLSEGNGGSHGQQHPFQIIIRDSGHPVTRGMPGAWMHANDELYDRLRGPAENMTVLATAWSDPKTSGSGRHEPILMSVEFGKGRVFHLPLGHGNDSQECVGFITTLQRAVEWAATGKVTQPIPDDFPGIDKTSSRPYRDSGQDK